MRRPRMYPIGIVENRDMGTMWCGRWCSDQNGEMRDA